MMNSYKIPSILLPLISIYLYFSVVLTQKVPVMLWSNHQLGPQFMIQSSLDDFFPKDLLNIYPHHRQVSKIALVQNNINVEQFSKAKLPFISKLFEENDAMFFPYSVYDPTFYRNFDSFVPLDGETLEQNEPIIQTVVERYNESGPIIFMLTGKSNFLYDSLDDATQKLRTRRQTEENNDNVLQFPKENPCVYVYVSKIDLYEHEDKNEFVQFKNIMISDGHCKNISETTKTSAEFVKLKMVNNTKTVYVQLNFTFDKSMMWKISSIEVEDEEKNKLFNNNINTYSENGFSYSCSRQIYKLKTETNISVASYKKIVFNRFQIQPFVLKKSQFKFEESFDCSVWFTLPIFSSLFVCLLLVLILYCGIRALLSISTPDRFENPKSKGLILTGVEE